MFFFFLGKKKIKTIPAILDVKNCDNIYTISNIDQPALHQTLSLEPNSTISLFRYNEQLWSIKTPHYLLSALSESSHFSFHIDATVPHLQQIKG